MQCVYQYIYRPIQGRNEIQAQPAVTICYIKDDSGKVARGISICSLKDQFMKARGRGIAYGRALKAIETQNGSSPIMGDKGQEAFFATGTQGGADELVLKSKYDVKLSDSLNYDDFQTLARLMGYDISRKETICKFPGTAPLACECVL